MPITYNYLKDNEKFTQLYRLYELLRLEHNQKGKDLQLGNITQQQYKGYIDNTFNPKHNEIIKEILKFREQFKQDNTINTTLNDIVV